MSAGRLGRMRTRGLRGACGFLLLGALTNTGLLGLGLGLEACASDGGDVTTGKRITLKTRIELEPSVAAGFTTAAGFHVTLDQALVATGPLYYFDGAPPVVFNAVPRDSRFAWQFLKIRTANAHPGHYQAGNAMGQMLKSWSVDLLDDAAKLADGEGITGTYRSARFTFGLPAKGPLAAELEGHAAIARGTAEKDGVEPRFFLAFADLADIEKSASKGHVEGCEFSEVAVEADGRVTVRVNPKIWFDLVDFAAIEPGSNELPSEFPEGSQPKIAFSQGLAQLSAYKFSYSEK